MKKSEDLVKARGERLKALRNFANLSRAELSKLVGNATSTLQYWEKGHNKGLPLPEAKRLIGIFNQLGIKCNLEWLYNGIGEEPSLSGLNNTMPSPNTPLPSSEQLQSEGKSDKLIKLLDNIYSPMLYLEISDDAMIPYYYPGDIVGGKVISPENSSLIIATHCILEIFHNQFICRIVTQGQSNNFNIMSANAATVASHAFTVNANILSIAAVQWILKESNRY